MSIFTNNKKKNKKFRNQNELIDFLSLPSFNSKQEEEINYKFGHLTGNSSYFLFKSGNRAIISSNGKKYNYYILQQNDFTSPIVYYKINDNDNPETYWNNPNYQWNPNLIFKDGVWREPMNNNISPEDNGISIIEAIVVSKYKSSLKNNNLNFDPEDWKYVYFDGNRWNSWKPTKERLLTYCNQFNKEMFSQIIEEYYL